MTKPSKRTVDRSLIVPIVGNAALAGPVVEGRLIPVLILDTSARPEVAELIRVHEHLKGGDAISQWATSREDPDRVILLLRFVQPIEVQVALALSIEHEEILVETMLTAGAVYFQAGTAGDRLMTTMKEPRVLVELPETGFRPYWDDIFLKRMTIVMSRRLGISRRKAELPATQLISEMRKLTEFRMRQV